MVSVFNKWIKSLSCKQPKLNFWIQIHPKKHFYAVFWLADWLADWLDHIFYVRSEQCNTVQRSAVQNSLVNCSAVQCSSVQYNVVQCSSVQCSAVQFSAVQCSAALPPNSSGIRVALEPGTMRIISVISRIIRLLCPTGLKHSLAWWPAPASMLWCCLLCPK